MPKIPAYLLGHLAFLGSFLFWTGIVAQPGRAAEQIALRTIDGRFCVRARLKTPVAEVPAYVMIDLGSRAPLLVHERTAALLGFKDRGNVDILFEKDGFTLSGVQSVAQGLEVLEDVTRNHAQELEDIPAAAILGLPALDGYWVELRAGKELRLARDPADLADAGGAGAEAPLAIRGHGYWIDLRLAGDQKLSLRFGTAQQDTLINVETLKKFKSHASDLDSLLIQNLDLARFTALRPAEFEEIPDPKPDLMMGTGLLRSFAVVLPPDRQRIIWRTVSPPSPDVAIERGLFAALLKEDAAGVVRFLEQHADHRLASLAAQALLELRSQPGPPDAAALRVALEWRARTTPAAKRARAMLDAADVFIELAEKEAAWYDQASFALDMARDSVSADPDDAAIHHLNARRGLICIMRKEYSQARRFLLSAAFALPRDAYINLWLGRLYEVTGQTSRAWSRYLESALAQGAPRGATQGLDRLNRDSAFRRTFTMYDAEALLEGRVGAFLPGSQYDSEAIGASPRLIELFINADEKPTQAAEMAFDGLRQYLEAEPTLFLQYHVSDTLGTPVSDRRASHFKLKATPLAVFDGEATCTEAGDDKAVSRVFSAYREAMVGALGRQVPSIPVSITAHVSGSTIETHVVVTGATAEFRVRLLLVEDAVMAIGENKQLMHHAVVRGELSPPQGWGIAANERKELNGRAVLSDLIADLEAYISKLEKDRNGTAPMRPTWIDLNRCSLVVVVQDATSGRVAACQAARLGNDDKAHVSSRQ